MYGVLSMVQPPLLVTAIDPQHVEGRKAHVLRTTQRRVCNCRHGKYEWFEIVHITERHGGAREKNAHRERRDDLGFYCDGSQQGDGIQGVALCADLDEVISFGKNVFDLAVIVRNDAVL